MKATAIDVACGTGALTLAAGEAVGPPGSVVGVDASPEMLAVARRKPGRVESLGGAEALPLPDGSFDAVISQSGPDVLRRRASGAPRNGEAEVEQLDTDFARFTGLRR